MPISKILHDRILQHIQLYLRSDRRYLILVAGNYGYGRSANDNEAFEKYQNLKLLLSDNDAAMIEDPQCCYHTTCLSDMQSKVLSCLFVIGHDSLDTLSEEQMTELKAIILEITEQQIAMAFYDRYVHTNEL